MISGTIKNVCHSDKDPFIRLFANMLLPPSKLSGILGEVRKAIQKTNKDYDLHLSCLNLYYGMKLLTFRINEKKNVIIQFLVFMQPYTKKQLILYQIETVPVPILD